jgi:peptidylprolyl isomerase
MGELPAPKARVVEFTVGGHKVMPGLSQGVIGMSQGDTKRLKLAPQQAYGPIQQELICSISLKRLSHPATLHIGSRLRQIKPSGRRRLYRVVAIMDDTVIADGNHPLAGRSVTFDVQLISVDSSSQANRSKPQFDIGGEA